MRIEKLGFSGWEDALPDEDFDVFHTREALQVLDEHTSADLRLYGGFKGQQRIGLAPMLVHDRQVGRLVTSPPLGFGVGRLGPIVTPTSPKQRKRERVNRAFIEQLLEATGAHERTTLFRMSCDTSYTDPRSFIWAGFNVIPSFTYQIDLNPTRTPDEVLSSFSQNRRKEVRNRTDAISVRTDKPRGAELVYESIKERYGEQGLSLPYSKQYVLDLVDALDERARVYAAESDTGEFLSGMIVLYSNDTAYHWKGGTKRMNSDSSQSANGLLHWQIMEDILTDPALDSITQYDMYEANNERLVRYKSSFGGDLVPYYTIESKGVGMKVAKAFYRMASLNKDPFGNQSLASVRKRLPLAREPIS